ncbi:hypothetical protein [Synechococcus sp. UW140]|uniref:hypothetical protein n=1 Tax=Synechococcus sp. UW140 TaxID=368503 RepID=UPI001FCBCAB1|nr:hypothetical protein [Synechococcus sp. UW140]
MSLQVVPLPAVDVSPAALGRQWPFSIRVCCSRKHACHRWISRHTGLERTKREAMGLRTVLRRVGSYILGVVDEYWAMREPSQYRNRDPQCEISCEGDVCVREDRTL